MNVQLENVNQTEQPQNGNNSFHQAGGNPKSVVTPLYPYYHNGTAILYVMTKV